VTAWRAHRTAAGKPVGFDIDLAREIGELWRVKADTLGIYYRKSDAKLGTGLRSAIATLNKNGTLMKLAIKYQIPVSDVK